MVLSNGEKIRYYRKKYKIKQNELYSGIMSQSMLSFLEQDKYQLSKEFAILLADRINNYIQNINEKITPEYLLRTKNEEVENYFKEKILLNIRGGNVDNNQVDYLISILEKNEFISEKIKIYTVIGNYFMKNRVNYPVSKILEVAINDSINFGYFDFFSILVLQLQRLYYLNSDYESTVQFYYKIINLLPKKNKEIMGHIYYNFALAFRFENKTRIAIFLYEKANSFFTKETKIINCKNNLGICYSLENNYNKALDIFLHLNEYSLSDYQRTVNYSNLLLCYIELNENISIKLTIDKLEKLIEEIPNNLRYQSYYCLGRAYRTLDDRYNAMINFEKELNLPIDPNNNHFYIKKYKECIEYLIEIYNENDLEKFKKLEIHILKIPSKYLDVNFFFNICKNFVIVYYEKEYIKLLEKLQNKD